MPSYKYTFFLSFAQVFLSKNITSYGSNNDKHVNLWNLSISYFYVMTIEQALNTKFIYSQLFDTEEQAYSMGKMSTVVEQSRFWKHEEDPLRHLVHLRVSECF